MHCSISFLHVEPNGITLPRKSSNNDMAPPCAPHAQPLPLRRFLRTLLKAHPPHLACKRNLTLRPTESVKELKKGLFQQARLAIVDFVELESLMVKNGQVYP